MSNQKLNSPKNMPAHCIYLMKNIKYAGNYNSKPKRVEQEYLIDSNVIIGYLDNKIPDNGMRMVDGIVDDLPNISIITK